MRLMTALALAALIAGLATPAAANGWRNGFFDAQLQRPHGERFQRPPQRDFRHPPQQDRGGRDGRMTEQERRDLHRDLDRANRELYKGRR